MSLEHRHVGDVEFAAYFKTDGAIQLFDGATQRITWASDHCRALSPPRRNTATVCRPLHSRALQSCSSAAKFDEAQPLVASPKPISRMTGVDVRELPHRAVAVVRAW